MDLIQHSKSQKNKILQMYGKTPADLEQDIENIKQWLKKSPHLPEIPPDNMIGIFLIVNKFRIERTKEKLDAYYSIRNLLPGFYNKPPNSPEIQQLMQAGYFIPLPKLTETLHRIIVIKFKGTDASKFDAEAFIAHAFNIAEIRVREDVNLKEIHIIDLKDASFSHMVKFSPTILKNAAFAIEKVFSNVIHAIHLINPPSFIDSILSLAKMLLSPKLADRIFVHGAMESLYKHVPKDMLPKDYGGSEQTLDELNERWRQLLAKYDHLFQHLSKLKVKEELRPEKAKLNDFFGVDGNFKQLNLD